MFNLREEYKLIYIKCLENKGKRDVIYEQICRDCLVKGKCIGITEKNRHKEKPEYGIYIKHYYIYIRKPCKKIMKDIEHLIKTKMIKYSTEQCIRYMSPGEYALMLYTEKLKKLE